MAVWTALTERCGGEVHEDGVRGTIFFANRASNFIVGGGGAVDGGGTVWNNDGSRGHFLVFYSCADARRLADGPLRPGGR